MNQGYPRKDEKERSRPLVHKFPFKARGEGVCVRKSGPE